MLINASYLIDLSLLLSEFLKFPTQFIVLSALKLSGVPLEKFEKEITDIKLFRECQKLLSDKAREVPVPTGLQKKYEGVVSSDLTWLFNC